MNYFGVSWYSQDLSALKKNSTKLVCGLRMWVLKDAGELQRRDISAP